MHSVKLLNIGEHNERALRLLNNRDLTGIECPKCRNELQYENKNIQLLSYPPQYRVICFECNYKGTIY